VYIYNRDHTRYFNSSKPANYDFHEFSLDLVKARYLRGNYKTAGEGIFTYGIFPGDSVGYIYISTFDENIIRSHDIDVIVKDLYNARSIIIDVRDNPGGFFDNLEYIASAFINSPVTYLMEKSRNGPGHNDFTSPLYYNIRPRPYARQYTKQIVLLTNRSTASAAEIFAVAFKQLPYSTQIGDSTAGGLGISNRTFLLPNGWTYHMPETLNLSVGGHSFEGTGVLPDIYVRNSRREIEMGYDRILEYALQYLSK
jgi:C-terminal processing protease CtpA/Prc